MFNETQVPTILLIVKFLLNDLSYKHTLINRIVSHKVFFLIMVKMFMHLRHQEAPQFISVPARDIIPWLTGSNPGSVKITLCMRQQSCRRLITNSSL